MNKDKFKLMSFYRYLFTAVFCSTMLFSCNNSSSNEIAEPTDEVAEPAAETQAVVEEEVVQTEENIEMQETDKQNVNNTDIVAQSLQFAPNEIRAKPNEKIQITLLNKGDVPYSIKFEHPDGSQELREPVPPGNKAALIFTTPKKKGTYSFYSPVTNHRDRGMTGKLIVE